MLNKAENKAKEFANVAQEKLAEFVESNERQINSTSKRYLSRGNGALQDAVETVKEQVEANPIGAVAITGVIGIFLGFILGRK